MPFEVKAYLYGRSQTAHTDSAREAFALAVEWQVADCAWGVSISNGNNCFTVAEFAWAMASREIADTVQQSSTNVQTEHDGARCGAGSKVENLKSSVWQEAEARSRPSRSGGSQMSTTRRGGA